MILYIVRHGEPDYEKDCLTEFGKKQAEAVGRRLAKAGVDRVFSSPMGRAQETAAPLCRMLGLEYGIEEWAREIGREKTTTFPDGVPKSIAMVQNTYYLAEGAYDLGYSRAFECRGICESDMKTAVDRIERCGDEFLERLGYRKEDGIYRVVRPNEERVALFCHAALGRAWLSVLLRVPLNIMWASFSYELTGVTTLEFRNNDNGLTAPRCISFSDTSHLYAEGLDNYII